MYLRLALILAKTALAVRVGNTSSDLVCKDMEISGPQTVKSAGTVIENTIIYVDPTSADSKANDYGLKIVAEDVTIRNVLIYHAANGMGIYAWSANNLVLENVQVIAYGNEWGA